MRQTEKLTRYGKPVRTYYRVLVYRHSPTDDLQFKSFTRVGDGDRMNETAESMADRLAEAM